MATDENNLSNLSNEQIRALRLARHDRFCTALPFPAFDWTDKQTIARSLAELRDYAEQLANSALDWYLQKKTTKKRYAAFFHYTTYAVGIVAAIIPLLKFAAILDLESVKRYLGQDSAASAAEMSLALIGLAGVLTFIDRTAGYTADWMRYIVTASRINRALIEFQFAWNRLEAMAPYPPTAPVILNVAVPDDKPPPPGDAVTPALAPAPAVPPDPVAQRIQLADDFCRKILTCMDDETAIWTDELKQRVAQLANQLPTTKRTP